jgi:hypothetical protein
MQRVQQPGDRFRVVEADASGCPLRGVDDAVRACPSQESDEIAGSLCTALGRCPGPQDRSVAIKPITELRRSFP